MGIFAWIKSQTGVWGPALLELYFQNAGWINTIVVMYGLLLVLSWLNLSRVHDALVEQILEQAKEMKGARPKRTEKQKLRLNDFELSWENAFATSKFPFIAKQTGLIVHRSTLENVHTLISEKDLILRTARRLEGMGFHLERTA